MPIPESEIERMEMERMIDWNFGKERQYIKPKAPTPKYVRPSSLATLVHDIANLPTDEEKIQRLRENKAPALLEIARYLLDDRIEFQVNPNCHYTPAQMAQESLSLYQEARRLYLLVSGGSRANPIQNNPVRMQQKFEELLHGLLRDEAELLIRIVQKKFPFDPKLFVLAFPELQPESEAAAKDKADNPRKNATTYAQDNLRDAVGAAQARIKKLDGQIRENEQQHRELMDLREREFHKIRIAGLRVGELS